MVLACVLPPGEMWDEYATWPHVDHWAATGRPAVYGRTTVDPAFLAAVARLPQPPPASFARTYGPFWAGAAAPPLPPPLGLYEAQHPFLYYALAAPVYRACGGRANLPAAVAALRLVNLACGTAAVALVLGWLAANVAPAAAVVLGCWVTLQPLLLLNVVRVANDGPAFLLGTAVVVAALDLPAAVRARVRRAGRAAAGGRAVQGDQRGARAGRGRWRSAWPSSGGRSGRPRPWPGPSLIAAVTAAALWP